MVGSWPRSMGLYTDGQLLVGSHWCESSGKEKIEAGSTVGLLVYLPASGGGGGAGARHDEQWVDEVDGIEREDLSPPELTQQLPSSPRQDPIFHFNINGRPLQFPSQAFAPLADLPSMQPPLYPTVSLFTGDTKVWCRFCEADVVYRSRESIGVAEGVRVYCLDGSLLLDDTD
eukprot:gene38614-46942_t